VARVPLTVDMGNSERVGYASFALFNQNRVYSRIKVSGPPTVLISFNSAAVFGGRIERTDVTIDADGGSLIHCHAYDHAFELLGAISPDVRASGDQGLATGTDAYKQGMDLVLWVSGVNHQSGATLAAFMSQYFGTQNDPTGTSGDRTYPATFKPWLDRTNNVHTWRSYYVTDGSPDVNLNYWLPITEDEGGFVVRREYAWDVLRRLVHENRIVNSGGTMSQFGLYVGVSGDINIFGDQSTQFYASGPNGTVRLVYIQTELSGAELNNVVRAKIPYDTTALKNVLLGNFPKNTRFPLDADSFTDVVAWSGERWSGTTTGTSLSGSANIVGTYGNIAIYARQVSGLTAVDINYNHPIGFNVSRFNVVGGTGVKFLYNLRWTVSGDDGSVYPIRNITLYDTSGNFAMKSGYGGIFATAQVLDATTSGVWQQVADTIYDVAGRFNSGNGRDGGWVQSATTPDFTRLRQIRFGLSVVDRAGGIDEAVPAKDMWVDNAYFSFAFNFNPVTARNTPAISGHGLRYEVFEYPFQVSDTQASGIIIHELNARTAPTSVAEVTVKDNPRGSPVQLYVRPGQALEFDAPSLNTGSGLTFRYWKATGVHHNFNITDGFYTTLELTPWYSGTATSGWQSNIVEFGRVDRYIEPYRLVVPGRTIQLPANYPFPKEIV